MTTVPIPATPENIEKAAALIRSGGLVAFPTETVYGLGCDAANGDAVAAVFEAKGRPQFKPLIIHVADASAAARLVVFNETAATLARAFWPGALTLILPRRAGCPVADLAAAGLATLAVRAPDHPVAQTLIRMAGRPITAPSANRSGRISPTTAGHVAADLGEACGMLLDGGRTPLGIESAIIDLCGQTPMLLRPGGITEEEICAYIGPLAPRAKTVKEAAVKYPGLPLRLNAAGAGPGEALLAFGPGAPMGAANLSPTGDLRQAAANLFTLLHDLDRPREFSAIAVMPVPDEGLGRAINDRLRRGRHNQSFVKKPF
jgi:L-threonylcarbamoyladenylate synthase